MTIIWPTPCCELGPRFAWAEAFENVPKPSNARRTPARTTRSPIKTRGLKKPPSPKLRRDKPASRELPPSVAELLRRTGRRAGADLEVDFFCIGLRRG